MTDFLYNDVLLTLGPETDPLSDPDFPLSEAQLAAISAQQLMQLLTEAIGAEPDLPTRRPRFVLSLCHLLHAKGGVNVVRVDNTGSGVAIKCGQVPDTSLTVLAALRDRGALTQAVVDEAVWDQLK